MSDGKPRDRSLGEYLLELAEHLREAFTAAVAGEGLTYMEGRVLRVALRRPDRAEIVAETRIAAPSVSLILAKLEASGLVERRTSDGDRRQRRVLVTPKGREALGRIFAHLDARSPLMTALGPAELDEMLVLVKKVLAAPAT